MIALPIPSLPAGEHFLDVQLLRDGSVADWGSSHFTVTSPVRVAGVSLETDVLRDGDTIRGTVALEGVTSPMVLETRVRDSYDRVETLRRFPVPPGQQEQAFALSLLDKQGIIFRVEAALLLSDGETISEGRAEFTVPKRITERRWLGVGWSGPSARPGALEKYRLLRRYGYEIVLSAFANEPLARATASCDQIMVPYMIRLMSCDANTCYTSDQWRREMGEGLEAHARMISKYGALGYSLGDEVRLNAYTCEQPTCGAAFRKWLAETYPSIEALNAEWGAGFKSFSEIQPSHVSEARQKDNYVPAMDYMAHRRDLWVETCKFCYDAIQRGDPGARMGYEGARGYERWPELLRFFRIAGPYTWPDNDIVFDQHTPGTIIGNWIGSYLPYGQPADHARYYTWQRVLLGCNSQWWWTLVYAMNGDNTPVDRFAANTEELAELQTGLGKLIINSEVVRDPVVLPYCPASDLVSQFYSDLTSVQASKDAMRGILHELGLRHWRIPMDRIAAGELDDGEHKVVLLPYHQATSEESATALRRFVEAGGLLIADLRPAIMNEHGRPLANGLLDDVFGIRRQELDGAPAEHGKPTVIADSGPVTALGNWEGELRADKSVAAGPGAEVGGMVGEVPICIKNRFGAGTAVLLNFALDEYVAARAGGAAWPVQEMFARLYAAAGVRPTVHVTVGEERPLDGLYMQRWRNGSMRIVGLDRSPINPARDGPAKITIRWPEKGHIYDIRAHRLLGERDTVETSLAIKAPRVYAWLPYEIGEVTIDAPPTVLAGERMPITVGLSAPEGQRAGQIVCLDVHRPDGTWRHYLRQRLRLNGPEVETHIALAYNAPPGTWRLTATEVISGKRAERTFDVEPAAVAVEGGDQ